VSPEAFFPRNISSSELSMNDQALAKQQQYLRMLQASQQQGQNIPPNLYNLQATNSAEPINPLLQNEAQQHPQNSFQTPLNAPNYPPNIPKSSTPNTKENSPKNPLTQNLEANLSSNSQLNQSHLPQNPSSLNISREASSDPLFHKQIQLQLIVRNMVKNQPQLVKTLLECSPEQLIQLVTAQTQDPEKRKAMLSQLLGKKNLLASYINSTGTDLKQLLSGQPSR
ncbi:hypothetical protein BB560_005383, partial [Smittium megazygosporum]